MTRPHSWVGATRRTARALGSAVALTWLLIGPPIEDGAPIPEAPRDLWRQYGAFRSQPECVRAKDFMGTVTGDGKYGWESEYWETMVRCAATDD